ncbi:SAM-dependent methyltransferase [Treponema sp. J25]|uniref:class I SAM-dependent methyltransferase n=1 Tax=Treponema sp. J25 TaxID=2094121 RepID=UPI0010453B72|nr:SAM-dependent methyltransferase [Treponema sp. J25]TCW61564.1 SAM-dependent methyltransferase [Treponema sp. J25]
MKRLSFEALKEMFHTERLLERLILAVASVRDSQVGPLWCDKPIVPCNAVRIRPVLIKETLRYQGEYRCGTQSLHRNYEKKELEAELPLLLKAYQEWHIYTDLFDLEIKRLASQEYSLRQTPASKKKPSLMHNREKNYRLSGPIPFLIHLGLMDETGNVFPRAMDKYKQINKYLEFIDAVLPSFPEGEPLRIVDFGCGKAYLTFGLYHYLHNQMGRSVSITGLDLKEEVIRFCNQVARDLRMEGLSFKQGDIARYMAEEPPHLVVSLHACDTATDAALAQALQWQSPVILAVPCCQHELLDQLRAPAMDPILRYGVTREKQATLVTDASRALMLRAFGYTVDMVEFIPLEHTPKNVLIRAYRDPHKKPRSTITIDDPGYRAYRDFLDTWGVGKTFLEGELSRRGLVGGPISIR